jgi:hypothetical protein
MGEEPDVGAIEKTLKVIAIILIVIIVGFGFLAGVCGLRL